MGLKDVSIQSEEHFYSTGRQINEGKIKYSQSSKMKTALLSRCTHNKGIYAIASLANVIVKKKLGGNLLKCLRKTVLPSYISFVVQYPSDSVNASSLSTSESSTSRVMDTSKEQSEPVLQYSASKGGKISVFTWYNVCQEENSAVTKGKGVFYLCIN